MKYSVVGNWDFNNVIYLEFKRILPNATPKSFLSYFHFPPEFIYWFCQKFNYLVNDVFCGLVYIVNYSAISFLHPIFQKSEKTFSGNAWDFILFTSNIKTNNWKNRTLLKYNDLNYISGIIDTTICQKHMPEKLNFHQKKKWYDGHHHKYGNKYQIVCDPDPEKRIIRSWFGPIPAGETNDNGMVKKSNVLFYVNKKNEKFLGDRQYRGYKKILIFEDFLKQKDKKMINATRTKVECIIGDIKHFGCNKGVIRHDDDDHRQMFGASINLINLFDRFKRKKEQRVIIKK